MNGVGHLVLAIAGFVVLFVVSASIEGGIYYYRQRRQQTRRGFPVLPARTERPSHPEEK